MGTLDNNNNIEAELQKQLQETSLSENEINEIVPKILELINLKENIENEQSEISTQNFLLDLRQDIRNNSNVSIDIKRNKGTVIGTITLNNMTNNVYVINLPSEASTGTTTEASTGATTEASTGATTEASSGTTTETSSGTTTETSSGTTTEASTGATTETSSGTTTEASSGTTTEASSGTTTEASSGTTTEATSGTTTEATSGTTTEATSGTTTETSSGTTKPQEKPREMGETTEAIDNRLEELNQNVLRTPEGYIDALNGLLNEIENAKSGIVKKGLSKDCKQSLKISKQNLEALEKQIKTIKTSIMRQRNPEISETYIDRFNTFKKNIGIIKNDIDSAVSGIPKNSTLSYDSIRDAERSNKQLEKINKLKSRLKEAVKEGAILSIFNQEEQKAIDFYTRIIEGTYTPEDFKLYKEHEGTFNSSFQRCGIELPILDPNQIQAIGGMPGIGQQSIQAIDIRSINRGQGIPQGGVSLEQGTQVSGQRGARIDYSNIPRQETFQRRGLSGVIDKALSNCRNMTPGQRDTWKSIGVLGAYAAGIFGLYKFFTNKDMSFRGKAGITAATIFGAQALTGEGPISLFNKAITGGLSSDELQSRFGSAFGDAVTGVGNSGIECAPTISGAMYSMMIFSSTTTVGDIRTMTSSFKDNNVWKVFRENAINTLKNKYGENSAQYFSTNFPETFDEQKRNAWLASFGITNASESTSPVYELANNASMNEIIIQKFKEENGLKETDVEVKKKEFHDYIDNLKNNNQALNIQTLKNHQNDWFKEDTEARYTIREIDKQNIKALEEQVENLPISDPQKKSELKTAIVRFYNERSINTKPILSDFSLKMNNDLLILSSHGQETKIKINTNEIHDFGNEIRFPDLSELLNVADLSNKILETQKGKQPMDRPPFQYKIGTGGRGIYFNDAEGWNFNFDTRVLSGGRGGAIGKLDTLSQHSDDFAKYLSKRREENNKINLDSYTILKEVGITFINKDEAIKSEELLKYIKNELRMYEKRDVGTAFEISTEITTKTYIKFFTRGGKTKEFDISDYPTFKNNKDQLLKYLNNPSNKMRESQRHI